MSTCCRQDGLAPANTHGSEGARMASIPWGAQSPTLLPAPSVAKSLRPSSHTFDSLGPSLCCHV